jgi:hypothetical protein
VLCKEDKTFIACPNKGAMNRTLKIAITVVLGIVLIATATAFAYSTMKNTQNADSPFSYIPSDSSFVARASYNGTTLFIFQYNNTTALMLNTVGIRSGNISYTSGNSTISIPIKFNSTYGGFQVYSINVSSSLQDILKFNSTLPSVLNISGVTLFAYMTNGGSVVVGTLAGVKDSINSFNSGSNFVSKSSFIDQNDNISFYLSPHNSTLPFSYAWGGVNGTELYAYLEMRNSTQFNFTGSFSYQGFTVKSLSSHELEVTYEFSNLSQLYSKLDSMR